MSFGKTSAGVFAAISLAAGLAAAGAAQAGPSNTSFAFSGGASTVLLLNGTDAFTATGRGWIDENGSPNGISANNNYIVGVCGSSDACNGDNLDRHDFFVFDLSNYTNAITSAVLQLQQTSPNGFLSTGPSLTYTNWDVSTGVGGFGLPIYTDLGSGVMYASTVITAASIGTTVNIGFNAAGIGALNAARGGDFAVGGAIGGGNSVPEPATWALMIGGFGMAGATLRRRRAATA